MVHTIFKAGHSDLNDGNGYHFVGYFSNEEVAKKAVSGFFIQNHIGSPAGIVTPQQVYDTLEEFEAAKKEEARQRAIHKLGKEDAKLLGLTE